MLLDYKIKDVSLQKKLGKEFQLLLRDALMLTILIASVLMIFRAKSLIKRLKAVYQKRIDRKELQSVNYLQKVKMITLQAKQEEKPLAKNNAQVVVVKKKLTNMNKNVMSIMLPYLNLQELNKLEQTSRGLALFVNHWPVWKNIYCDYYLGPKCAERLPLSEHEMTEEERVANDYRAACKRCYLYIKKN